MKLKGCHNKASLMHAFLSFWSKAVCEELLSDLEKKQADEKIWSKLRNRASL